jgi:hypothetical protein
VEFKKGDLVIIRGLDGIEYEGVIFGQNGEEFQVKYRHPDLPMSLGFTESTIVLRDRLVLPPGPFFRINGEVLTDDPNHAGQTSKILAIGKTLNGKQFFKIKFKDDGERWFSEDRVFIDDAVLAKWNKDNDTMNK